MARSFAAYLALLLASFGFGQTAKHPFGLDDMANLRQAFPSAVSTKGQVLFVVTHGGQSGPTVTEWHVIGLDGSSERKLDLPEGFRPTGFTKDGDLHGIFTVNKSGQLAIFAFPEIKASSLPKSVIFLPMAVQQAKISPDGARFAVIASQDPPEPDSKFKTVIQADHRSIYVVNVDGSAGKWWAPQLTDVGGIAWNPDSRSIAVLSSTPKLGFHFVKSQIDIATETETKAVAKIDTAVNGIGWADGGKTLAFLSTTTSVITPDHVWTVPAAGGTPVDRTPKLQGSATGLSADPNGGVWVQVNKGVHPECDRFEGNALSPAFSNTGLPVTCEVSGASTNLIFNSGDPEHAANLFVASGGSLKRITTEGDDQLASVDFGPAKVIHWTSKEGVKLEGIATFPAGFTEGHRYPFLVLPHGGPEGNDTYNLDTWSRFFAGLGYVVIQPQYRGSTGYGTDFLNSIYQHFGDRAYRDVDSATDYAIQQGWADPNRLAMMGWSAGGFMTSWTVTQTHRYKAAIEGAGITDWGSFIWTSDVQQIDYDARWPGKEPQYFHEFSAVDFADRVTTPLLILHGAADRRVPTFQGQEYYEALLAQGKTARMVTYPGSGHFPSLWEQRRDVFTEAAAWLKKFNP